MRDKMPTVAAFIDDLRAALGKEVVDQAIREGLQDGTFHARENGHEVGQPVEDDSDRAVKLCDMFPFNSGIDYGRRDAEARALLKDVADVLAKVPHGTEGEGR